MYCLKSRAMIVHLLSTRLLSRWSSKAFSRGLVQEVWFRRFGSGGLVPEVWFRRVGSGGVLFKRVIMQARCARQCVCDSRG